MAPTQYFLKIAGVTGEVQDAGHQGEIALQSFSLGTSGAGSGSGTGKVAWTNVKVTMQVNRATPTLIQDVATAKPIGQAIIAVRSGGDNPADYLRITLSNVIASSYYPRSEVRTSLPYDEFTFSFATIAKVYLADLTSVQVNDGTPQRSAVTSLVATLGSGSVGAFTLTDGAGNALKDISVTASAATAAGANQMVKLTFSVNAITGGSLPDGYYQLWYNGAAAPVLTFFRLFGDSNGDSQVDATDQIAFLAANGSTKGTTTYKSYFDFDGDGTIDVTDVTHFQQRYNTRLNPDGTVTTLP